MARNKYVIKYDAGDSYVCGYAYGGFELSENINKAIKYKTSGEAAKDIEKRKNVYGNHIAYTLTILEVYTAKKPLKRSEFRKYGTRYLKEFIK